MKLSMISRILILLGLGACGGWDSVAPSAGGPGSGVPGSGVPLTISSLNISGAQSGLERGQGVLLTVTATTIDGRVVSDGVVNWESSNPVIAAVASAGARTAFLSGLGTGVAKISAQLRDASNSIEITIGIVVKGQKDGYNAAFIYNETDGMEFIPLPAGATAINALAVNDRGQVVGTVSYAAAPSRAFLWSRAEGLKDIGLMPAGHSTVATAISQNGQVAGYGYVDNDVTHAFRWTSAAGMVDLGVPSGMTNSFATGINNSGRVVGSSSRFHQYGCVPFRWSVAGGFENLLAANSGICAASAVNEAGQVVGWTAEDDYDFGIEYTGAFFWSGSGAKIDIASCQDRSLCGAALAVNSSGVVAGTNGRAFTWTSEGGIRVVPGTPTSLYNAANGISDDGTVMGNIEFYERPGTERDLRHYGFLWSASGGYREIRVPVGRRLLYLTGINNNGQIVGYVE